MAKFFAPLLAGVCLPLTLPALAADGVGKAKDESEYATKAILREIKGRLGPLFGHRAQGRYSAEVRANGATYELDFFGDPQLINEARQLEGRTVVVTGLERAGSGRILVTGL